MRLSASERHSATGRLTSYIVEMRIAEVHKGQGYKKVETFYVPCDQRRRSLLSLVDDLGHNSVPEVGARIKAHIYRRNGKFEGNISDWFDIVEPAESESPAKYPPDSN